MKSPLLPSAIPVGFYVYRHVKASTGEPFYIGKGKGKRAWSRNGRSKLWHRVSDKHEWLVEVIEQGLDESSALNLEVELIARLGRLSDGSGPLVNITLGGEGTSGWRPSEATRLKISASNIGRKLTKEQRAAVSDRQRGMKRGPMDQARKDAIALSKIGTTLDADARLKISIAQAERRKPIKCVELGISFFSARHAASWLQSEGISKAARTSVSRCAKGIDKTAYGYTWRYIEKAPA